MILIAKMGCNCQFLSIQMGKQQLHDCKARNRWINTMASERAVDHSKSQTEHASTMSHLWKKAAVQGDVWTELSYLGHTKNFSLDLTLVNLWLEYCVKFGALCFKKMYLSKSTNRRKEQEGEKTPTNQSEFMKNVTQTENMNDLDFLEISRD